MTARSAKERFKKIYDTFQKDKMASLRKSGTDEQFEKREQLLTDLTELKMSFDNKKTNEKESAKVKQGKSV